MEASGYVGQQHDGWTYFVGLDSLHSEITDSDSFRKVSDRETKVVPDLANSCSDI